MFSTRKLIGLSLTAVFLFGISSVSINAESQSVPDWVKNNAKWWAEGNISETDYISALQFLVNQGILQIPITNVIASDSPVINDDRAQSIVVSFFDGPATGTITFDTFSKFSLVGQQGDQLVDSMTFNFGDEPKFYLESLPSKDKAQLYNFIDSIYFSNKEQTIEPFDVDVALISGDATTIQTWHFTKCHVTGYGTYLQDITNFYPFSGEDGGEYRDRTIFACLGASLTAPT